PPVESSGGSLLKETPAARCGRAVLGSRLDPEKARRRHPFCLPTHQPACSLGLLVCWLKLHIGHMLTVSAIFSVIDGERYKLHFVCDLSDRNVLTHLWHH